MGSIKILGLGPGELEQLSLGIYRELTQAKTVWIRTLDHPLVTKLADEGVNFISFDHVYEEESNFSEVYERITERLLEEAGKGDGELVYAVPGHPLVAEETVQKLLEQQQVNVEIAGGGSFLDAMFTTLRIDPIEGFQLLDGLAMQADDPSLKSHLIIAQVFDAMSASEVKLKLMERLPDTYPVTIVDGAGTSKEQVKTVPLFELDRETALSNLTALYVPPVTEEELLNREFDRLRAIIRTLRGPGGCPWDQKQTHESLKRHLIEEAYELLEAIDEEDDDHIAEELGDILLQVMLHAQIGEDAGYFTINDVIGNLSEKMVRRHPHVFADVEVSGAEDVVTNWEAIKAKEAGSAGRSSVLDGIPKGLPGLSSALKLQKKAGKVGFDWGSEEPMWEKLFEEIHEWAQEVHAESPARSMKEFGDVLFAFVNIARFHGIDPEEAIRQTNEKFRRRFDYVAEQVYESGKQWGDFSLEELDLWWDKAKEKGL
ncbi:bifunctional methyltransferase/pyrophosphohydrolase YabN [Salisediminibacterium beveridgei]|uniref:Putative tetrapyrrole methyltransferase / Nucleoside triphosphate pyrophosphohydrolase MazG n=1 Tax=Salisediminibacterium beveridgei TaxID=632773 RepID=A0A1D7R031_9BACI|nr:nucleoside triphosphate pyrophosphohydrolase [Salisediminibacterium beveridgei]AOM84617.1 putative tetrapyrrole methyltransferase / Nucleoside triphosphate pyrophosphohydrolase MazG [Salisediminibacterium beveridgei]